MGDQLAAVWNWYLHRSPWARTASWISGTRLGRGFNEAMNDLPVWYALWISLVLGIGGGVLLTAMVSTVFEWMTS